VKCDEVRDQLAEHLLGTLDEPTDLEIRRHLRGCGACRREMAALGDGVSLFATAVHDVEPPPELKERVLAALRDDRAEAPATPARHRPTSWLAIAAAVVLLAGSVAWGVRSDMRARHYEASASKYEAFLGALGGENVRVGTLAPVGTQQLEGSAVVYDSKVEQSWVLVLVRAPGMQGGATVTLSSQNGRTIPLHPMTFSPGGEASSWLITSSNLRPFTEVTIRDDSGAVIATGTVSSR
jgi:anti-sigma factor RsiW